MHWKQYILETYRKIKSSPYGWSGDYSNWEDACKDSGAYDAISIFEKVQAAAIKVQNGEAAYERDSVLFNEIEYSWPMLAGITWVAAKNKGKVLVADFGGSLGSSYFQNKLYLDELPDLKWCIIEQSHFVQSGRQKFQNKRLEFFNSMEDCIGERGIPDILILSCVLPYLQEPYELLKRMIDQNLPHILIDNTYFNYENRDRICIQHVPPQIYEASYPCWLLSRDHVQKYFKSQYKIISEHKNDSAIYIDGKKIIYEGFLASRIE
jgi:putative methyltransferase (TIGR04325 family)